VIVLLARVRAESDRRWFVWRAPSAV
jgi:hypothetical protein